jgi:hypothetical protein
MVPRTCLDLLNTIQKNIEFASIDIHFIKNEELKKKLVELTKDLDDKVESFKQSEKSLLNERI